MAGPARPASALQTRRPGLRQPTRRAGSAVPERLASPAVSSLRPPATSSLRAQKPSPEVSGAKRKDRDYEREINEDTSIHVVVRCRGRSARETKENSGVVVSTDGVKGTAVTLSMGPNALSNKTYAFDKVFSQAADQTVVYEDVVLPILNEVSLATVDGPVKANLNGRCWQATTARSSRTAKQGRERHIPCREI